MWFTVGSWKQVWSPWTNITHQANIVPGFLGTRWPREFISIPSGDGSICRMQVYHLSASLYHWVKSEATMHGRWWVRVACPKPLHIAKSWIWTHDIVVRGYKPKPMGHEPPFSLGLGLHMYVLKNTYHSVWRVNKTAYTNMQSEQMIKWTLTFQKNTILLCQLDNNCTNEPC